MKIGPLDSLPAASPVATERRASAAANAHGDTEGLRVELVSRQLLAGEPARADIDPAKVDLKKTYTTEFVKGLRILP